MKLRIKKVCRCKYIDDFPYIHCTLNQKIFFDKNENTIIIRPMFKTVCKQARIKQAEKELNNE